MIQNYRKSILLRAVVCYGLAIVYVVMVVSIIASAPGLRLSLWLIKVYGTVAFLTATFFTIRWYVAGTLLLFIAFVLFLLVPYTTPKNRLMSSFTPTFQELSYYGNSYVGPVESPG